MAAHRSRERFPVPQAKFETLRHLRFSFAKKYSRSKFRFSLLRKQHGKSIFMRHRKSDITLRRRNVSRLCSIQFFRILYSHLFTIPAWSGWPLFLRSKFQQLKKAVSINIKNFFSKIADSFDQMQYVTFQNLDEKIKLV